MESAMAGEMVFRMWTCEYIWDTRAGKWCLCVVSVLHQGQGLFKSELKRMELDSWESLFKRDHLSWPGSSGRVGVLVCPLSAASPGTQKWNQGSGLDRCHFPGPSRLDFFFLVMVRAVREFLLSENALASGFTYNVLGLASSRLEIKWNEL